MFSQSSLTGQPKPHTSRNNVKEAVRAILILVFVVIIVILLTLAVILSGRTATAPIQTPSPTPTKTPTAAPVLTSSVIAVSVGFPKPHKSEVRLGLEVEKSGDWWRT